MPSFSLARHTALILVSRRRPRKVSAQPPASRGPLISRSVDRRLGVLLPLQLHGRVALGWGNRRDLRQSKVLLALSGGGKGFVVRERRHPQPWYPENPRRHATSSSEGFRFASIAQAFSSLRMLNRPVRLDVLRIMPLRLPWQTSRVEQGLPLTGCNPPESYGKTVPRVHPVRTSERLRADGFGMIDLCSNRQVSWLLLPVD